MENNTAQKIQNLETENNTLKQQVKRYEEQRYFTPNQWYVYWRTALKDQSTNSSGIFFIFSAAVLGYIINSHSFELSDSMNYVPFNKVEKLSVLLIAASVLFYGLLSISRFFDYRIKSLKYYKNKDIDTVLKETNWIKNCSLFLYLGQILLFITGFLFQIIEIYRVFYNNA